MKKSLFLLFFCPLFAIAQTQSFTINGKLDGYTNGTKISLYKNGEATEWATANLAEGKFTFKNKVTDPVLCFIVIDGVQKPIELYVENAIITVKGNKSTPDKYEISGSRSHKDFEEFIKAFLPEAQELSRVSNEINSVMPGKLRDSLMGIYNGVQDRMQKVIDDAVKTKPRSAVNPFILEVTYQFKEDVVVLEERFRALDASIKKMEAGKKLEAFIAEKKIGAVGTQAMDFTQADTTGSPVSLSSFRGKYVLVDFWASWCVPCRNENPNVVENFNTFNKKNFTVLGVSLDRPGQKDKWINAIKEDGLNWTQVSDLQFWNNAAAQLYRISSIPQNLLIDPNGKIIAKNLRGPALREKLCEVLGCN